MNKNETNQYRQFINVALQSAKIYTDMGGDTTGIHVLSALFKWPDVVGDLLDIIDGKKAKDILIADIGQIMLNPLVALASAYLARADLPPEEKQAYDTIVARQPANTIKEIMSHRDLVVNILVRLTSLKEKKNEGRDSRTSQ